MRIKGVALAHSGHIATARLLWQRVLADPLRSIQGWLALEDLADLALREGQLEEAERLYRQLIADNPTLNATSHMAEVSLAEMLLARHNQADCEEALQLLQSALSRGGLLDGQLFRWHLALLEAANQLGDSETQRRAARTALVLADRGPRFSRHPTVGLVQADEATMSRLRSFAAE